MSTVSTVAAAESDCEQSVSTHNTVITVTARSTAATAVASLTATAAYVPTFSPLNDGVLLYPTPGALMTHLKISTGILEQNSSPGDAASCGESCSKSMRVPCTQIHITQGWDARVLDEYWESIRQHQHTQQRWVSGV